MTTMTDKLTDAIRMIIGESQRLGVEKFGDALMEIGDNLGTGSRGDDLYIESVIDGIRWGVRAAITVDLAGGALLRVILPDGGRITHEWATEKDAESQINAALAAIISARVTASRVGK